MFVVKRVDKALQITGPLSGRNQRAEIPFDRVIRQFLGMLIGRTQSVGRTVDRLVRQHGVERFAQSPGFHHCYKRLEGYWWPVVVRVAIGKREGSNAFWIESAKYLTDSAPAVISDDIHLIDGQGVEKLGKHFRIRGNRYILIGADFRVAMRQEINCDGPAYIGKRLLLMTPEIAVQQHAVHEQRGRPGTSIGIADAPRRSTHALL